MPGVIIKPESIMGMSVLTYSVEGRTAENNLKYLYYLKVKVKNLVHIIFLEELQTLLKITSLTSR